MSRSRTIGIFETLIASIGFGFLGYFGKLWLTTGESINVLLAYRFAIAALLYFLLVLFFRPRLFKVSLRQLGISAALGILGYSLFATLYFKAIEGLSIALASLLLNMHPLIVTILSSMLLGVRISRSHWLACFVGTGGLALFLWGEVEIKSYWAVLAGLGAAMSYATYIVISSRLQGKDIHPVTSSFYVILSAAIMLSVIAQGSPMHILEMSEFGWKVILGMALVSTVIPLTLILSGLQKIKSHESALISMAEPITASIVSWLLFKDPWNLQKVLGASLIVGAMVTVMLKDLRKSGQPQN